MFTGIIEEKGKVLKMEPDKLHIRAQKVLEGTKVGDSIAVNGVCLTVTALDGSLFTADVMPETMQRSSLGALRSGSGVNLERAMAADGRFAYRIRAYRRNGDGREYCKRRQRRPLPDPDAAGDYPGYRGKRVGSHRRNQPYRYDGTIGAV